MRAKRLISALIKLILTVTIFAVILKKVDLEIISATFVAPKKPFLLAALVLVIPNFVLKFSKWHYLLKVCKIQDSVWNTSKSYLAGLAIGLVTPARVGEMGRALFLNKQERLKGTGVVLIDKTLDLIGILLISLIGVRIFLEQSVFFFVAFLVVAGTGLLLFSKSFNYRLRSVISKRTFGGKLLQLLSGLDHISGRVVLISILLTLFMFFVVLLQCYVLVKAFYDVPLPFNVILFAYPLVILANILPITIGGLGVREGVAVFCLSIFNIPAEVAVTATLYLFIINFRSKNLLRKDS